MSHPEQQAFLAGVVSCNTDLVSGGRVIEIGSYSVNGSVRDLFSAATEYVGVDLTEGPSVDIVSYGHAVEEPDDSFDVALSGECFEHDPHWRDTFANMIRMTRPGGLVVFTCATRGRPEHGTTRTQPEQSPGTQARGHDYYRNLTAEDFEESFDLSEAFSEYRFWTNAGSFDLYFVGVRTGAFGGKLPSSEVMAGARKASRWGVTLPRLPLYVLVHVLPERTYDRVANLYWNRMLTPYFKAADRWIETRQSRGRHTTRVPAARKMGNTDCAS